MTRGSTVGWMRSFVGPRGFWRWRRWCSAVCHGRNRGQTKFYFRGHWRIRRDGWLLYADDVRLVGDARSILSGSATGRDACAFASIVAVEEGVGVKSRGGAGHSGQLPRQRPRRAALLRGRAPGAACWSFGCCRATRRSCATRSSDFCRTGAVRSCRGSGIAEKSRGQGINLTPREKDKLMTAMVSPAGDWSGV